MTAAQSRETSLLRFIKHWSTSRAQQACCPLHRQLRLTKEVLKDIAAVPCDPLWSPWTGWQCPNCTCANRLHTSVCEVCQWIQQLDVSVDIDIFELGCPMLRCTPHFEMVFGACQSRLFSDLVEHPHSFRIWLQERVNTIENGLQGEDSQTLLLRHPSFGRADARGVVSARCRLECLETGDEDDSDTDNAVMTLRLLDLSEPILVCTDTGPTATRPAE